MPVPTAAAEVLGELACRAAALEATSGGNLLECFTAVPDPRRRRWRRLTLPSVLALCLAAVLCENTAIEDVTAWAHAASQEVLAAAGARRLAHWARGWRRTPAPWSGCCPRSTPRAWPARPGRTWPPAHPARPRSRWPGRGRCRPSRWTARRCCASWTPITPWPGTHVITSDVGRTVKDHATLICGEILAHYVFTVKQNTPALWDELDALDWKAVPVQNATQEKGHGRRERRTIQVMKAPEHVAGYVRGQARNTRPFYTRA